MAEISIIVPVYNAEDYIERCLDSILKQTYEDYEVVLINDGSVDNSELVCQRYCDMDERFRLVSQKNSGPDIARRTGLKESAGQYIMYMDSDDYIAANTLEVSISAAIKYNAQMVCSQRVRFNDDGKQWDTSAYDNCDVIYDAISERMRAYFVDGKILGSYCSKLIHRDLILDYPFVENAVIGEDVTAILYMLQKANRIVVIPDLCYFYYWNLNSVSHTGYSSRHEKSLKNYIQVRDDILKKEYLEEKYICGFFAEFEMAVATAMSRSWVYDKKVAKLLKDDINGHWKYIRANEKTPLYMKICMEIYRICPMLFIMMYRVVYLTTGR